MFVASLCAIIAANTTMLALAIISIYHGRFLDGALFFVAAALFEIAEAIAEKEGERTSTSLLAAIKRAQGKKGGK